MLVAADLACSYRGLVRSLLSNPQIPLRTPAIRASEPIATIVDNVCDSEHRGAFQRLPRTGSPLCSAEDMRRVYFLPEASSSCPGQIKQ